MKKTAQKLILISFVLALIAAVTVFSYLNSLKKPETVIEKTAILVAAKTIPARTLIDKDMIMEIKVTKDSIFDNYINDSSRIIGKYTKTTIFQNEGFNTDKLLDTNENELSLKISSNHRAMSISVTGDTGVSDLLKPGDYVDIVLFTANIMDGENEVIPSEARIILQNIELLAVNKQISREDAAADGTSKTEEVATNFLVTLSLPISDLEKLVLAESVGSIKLALRPFKDESTVTTTGTTMEDLSAESGAVSAEGKMPGEGRVPDEGLEGVDYILYTVKKGDTLQSISNKFYGDKSKYEIIMEANNIQNKNLILTVEVLKIPILESRR